MIEKKHNTIFFKELISLFQLLEKKENKLSKIRKLKILLKRNKVMLKLVCGMGIKHLVGHKI